ncbi:MAG: ASKHA domain-containing protein [Desulfosudaceae bacterium]
MKSLSNTTWIEDIFLPTPSLDDNTGDTDRLLNALAKRLGVDDVQIDLELARKLPGDLRLWNYRVRCVLFADSQRYLLVGVTSADEPETTAGLAVDLGTTRVVVRLLDLATGRALSEASFENPQTLVGDDILTRIHYENSQSSAPADLHRLIIEGLNQTITDMCAESNLSMKSIYLAAVAGNTTMTHFFLNLPTYWIIREPYIPAANQPGIVRASLLGINANPLARIFVFPNIGSYFGGDLLSGILYSGIHNKKSTALLVDVGTNAEVVLGNRDWLIACAGAAGPALEGGVAEVGAKAGPGIIDRVSILPDSNKIKIRTINNQPPTGICGSGLIDLVAALFRTGVIDIRGKLDPDIRPGWIKDNNGIKEFIIVPAEHSGTGQTLTLSQPDIDNLIRSKAAMYTILRTLTTSVGLSFDDIAKFYVAGTFGSFINPVSAITIGMLPDLPPERFEVLGNSSLEGATQMLVSRNHSPEVTAIKKRLTYLELNVNQDFMNRFSAAKFLPHTDASRFPSVSQERRTKKG